MFEVKNLEIKGTKQVTLIEEVSFAFCQGEAIGLTGQSGSGKTTLMKAIMGILGATCKMSNGSIVVDGLELNNLSSAQRRNLCGTTLGYIPQNPITAFDGRLKIGDQMIETFRIRLRISRTEAKRLSFELLEKVNLAHSKRIMESFPGQLSGGMLQRVSVAMLLGLKPNYIFADEPTSALDELNRMLLLEHLKQQVQHAGVFMISHDVSALENLCSRVFVMEKGKITEEGTMKKLLTTPKREWTKQFSLLNSKQDRRMWQWKEF